MALLSSMNQWVWLPYSILKHYSVVCITDFPSCPFQQAQAYNRCSAWVQLNRTKLRFVLYYQLFGEEELSITAGSGLQPLLSMNAVCDSVLIICIIVKLWRPLCLVTNILISLNTRTVGVPAFTPVFTFSYLNMWL
jgi:hypothetical protein